VGPRAGLDKIAVEEGNNAATKIKCKIHNDKWAYSDVF
jgi:hypothetical protein